MLPRFVRTRIRAYFVLLTASIISFSFASADTVTPTPSPVKRIVVIGSSVAAGMGASRYDHCWVGLLSKALRTRGWTVLNRSISGNTTSDVLKRLQRDALTLKPNIVIIALGFHNEGLTNASDPDAVFNHATENLLTMAAQIRAAGAEPVLAGVYPNNHWGDPEKAYVTKFYEWAQKEHLPTLDFFTTTEDGHGRWKDELYNDKTHPNDAGHDAMFKSIPLDLFDQILTAHPLKAPRPTSSPK